MKATVARSSANGNRTLVRFTGAGPAPIAAYLKAADAADSQGLLACFADDAIVVDVEREFYGKVAIRIRDWSDHHVFAAKISQRVEDVREHYGDYIVLARIEHVPDKTAAPVLMTFYFTLREGKVVKLICMLLKPPDAPS